MAAVQLGIGQNLGKTELGELWEPLDQLDTRNLTKYHGLFIAHSLLRNPRNITNKCSYVGNAGQ